AVAPVVKDTAPKRRVVPGMNAPDNRKSKEEVKPDAKNNLKPGKDSKDVKPTKDNKRPVSIVNEQPINKPKKPKPQNAPVKGSDDNIKNEFE
nr:hypothetical protein [Chitinophagaceae bacterium]